MTLNTILMPTNECFEYGGPCKRCHYHDAGSGRRWCGNIVASKWHEDPTDITDCPVFRPQIEFDTTRAIYQHTHEPQRRLPLQAVELAAQRVDCEVVLKFGDLGILDELRSAFYKYTLRDVSNDDVLAQMVTDAVRMVERKLDERKLAVCDGGFEAEL